MNWSKTRQGSVNLAMLTVATMLGAGLRDAVGALWTTQDEPEKVVLRANEIELTAPGDTDAVVTIAATPKGGFLFLRGEDESVESSRPFIVISSEQAVSYKGGPSNSVHPCFALDWSSGCPVGQLFDEQFEEVWQGPMMPIPAEKK